MEWEMEMLKRRVD
ncbi:unnamed protein product [Arabidopsis thaliana]|uniref:Uncharacterized protein n=1 Tax=Arabidopsis thaliana TaxID=3702 RepID=A0A654GFP8_ARATH|nr:unnamed protein product [Arabidopsis thaliana]